MTTTEGAKVWRVPLARQDHRLPSDLPPAVAKILLARGIDNLQDLQRFLEPPQRLPYDPMRLSGMDRAVQRVYQAVQRGEQVGVFGDFDVDGVTGTAIVAQGLAGLGVKVVPYLPHRVDEGHGLSGNAVRYLVDGGAGLIITVDCGITSGTEVAHAAELGAEVIITDHHTPPELLPEAVAIINPRVSSSQYPCPDLSGAGLAFKLVQGVWEFYGRHWERSLLELAALGTIADLVPLTDENRFLAREGLTSLSHTERVGLQALYRRASIRPETVDADTVAFQIAPRLNSPGRMSHALDSFRLLTTHSEEEAEYLADKLEGLNQARRELTEAVFAAVFQEVESRTKLPAIILAENPSVTPGVAGLVAGRLAEHFHRPAVVMAQVDGGYLTGSGRSIPEFNIIKALTECGDLFLRFGGHSQAAGFTVARSKLPVLEERLTAAAEAALSSHDLRPTLIVDAEIKLSEITPQFMQWQSSLAPFGVGNPQPLLLTRGLQVVDSRYVGQAGQHLQLVLREDGQDWRAVAFNQANGWHEACPFLDIVYTAIPDHWRGGEAVTIKIVDYRLAPR